MEMKKLQQLLWREYLRGFINGGHKRREYNLQTLKAEYRKYRKDNPSLKKEMKVV